MIIDIDDKITAKVKKYTKENITDYEVNSRDNRIGEITNVATSITNSFTEDPKYIKQNEDNISLLRIFQGKEIDFQKTGLRWQMNKHLRRHLKKLPFFLLFNYPKKMNSYHRLKRKNKEIVDKDDKMELNAYRSPSPMNELADYVETWEKKNIIWDKSIVNTSCIILNNNIKLDNKLYLRQIKHLINEFANVWRKACMNENKNNKEDNYDNLDIIINNYKQKLSEIIENEEILANYVIKASYSNMSISKALAWKGYGEYIINNLKANSPVKKYSLITESPYDTDDTYEFLGKYYKFWDGDKNV